MYSPIMVSMRIVCSKCCMSYSVRVWSPLGEVGLFYRTEA